MTDEIKIGIIGVGNCASTLIQGIEYYKKLDAQNNDYSGVLYKKIGKYSIGNIKCVSAFDVDINKIGKDLSEAIFSPPNCTTKFSEVPNLGVKVQQSPVFDSIGNKLEKIIKINPKGTVDNISDILEESGTQILINYLPVGSSIATEYFANESIKAGCGFINCIPVFIGSSNKWSKKFSKAHLPLAGDDVKSQIGATILNRTLLDLFNLRGISLENSIQTNKGGNLDFYNLSEESRISSKIISKTTPLKEIMKKNSNITVLPPEYEEGMNDRKFSKISLNGKYFGNSSVNIELNLDVEDSPNSSGVVVDVIRLMKLALENNLSGNMDEICPFYFKHPSCQIDDHIAYNKVKMFIEKYQ